MFNYGSRSEFLIAIFHLEQDFPAEVSLKANRWRDERLKTAK